MTSVTSVGCGHLETKILPTAKNGKNTKTTFADHKVERFTFRDKEKPTKGFQKPIEWRDGYSRNVKMLNIVFSTVRKISNLYFVCIYFHILFLNQVQ